MQLQLICSLYTFWLVNFAYFLRYCNLNFSKYSMLSCITWNSLLHTSLSVINNYLDANGYRTSGECFDDYMGIDNYESKASNVQSGKKYYYCYKENLMNNNNINKKTYNVTLFYKFNLPFVGDLFIFKINGQTKSINNG